MLGVCNGKQKPSAIRLPLVKQKQVFATAGGAFNLAPKNEEEEH